MVAMVMDGDGMVAIGMDAGGDFTFAKATA